MISSRAFGPPLIRSLEVGYPVVQVTGVLLSVRAGSVALSRPLAGENYSFALLFFSVYHQISDTVHSYEYEYRNWYEFTSCTGSQRLEFII
eukprot:scaffold55124_cov35-Prasinocladus_malaysianus.AAC.1